MEKCKRTLPRGVLCDCSVSGDELGVEDCGSLGDSGTNLMWLALVLLGLTRDPRGQKKSVYPPGSCKSIQLPRSNRVAFSSASRPAACAPLIMALRVEADKSTRIDPKPELLLELSFHGHYEWVRLRLRRFKIRFYDVDISSLPCCDSAAVEKEVNSLIDDILGRSLGHGNWLRRRYV